MTQKELEAFSRKNNYKAALYFWPELNGKNEPGYVLHHKDPTLKYRDPVRYAEWRPEDLEPLTVEEHHRIHWQDCEFRKRQSDSLKRNWSDPVFKKKMREIQIIANARPDVKEKKSIASKIAKNRPEAKEWAREFAKNLWKTKRTKMMTAIHAGLTSEVIEQRNESIKDAWKDPELRKRHSKLISSFKWYTHKISRKTY